MENVSPAFSKHAAKEKMGIFVTDDDFIWVQVLVLTWFQVSYHDENGSDVERDCEHVLPWRPPTVFF